MDNDNFLPKIATLLENVKSNISIINNLKEHFKILLFHNIIQIIKYSDIVDKLKFLNSESVKQSRILKLLEQITLIGDLEDNSENNFNLNNHELIIKKIKTVKNNSETIFEELVKIIYDYGYLSISLFLNITNKDLFKKYNNDINLKISCIEQFFQITKVDKKNIDFKDDVCLKIKNISPEPIKKLPKLSIIDKIDIEIVDDDKLKINLIYELNKACIQIEIADTLYIFDGYFKEDTFNEIYQEEMFEKKYKNIQQKILANNSDTKFKSFFKEYMGQLSTKDFIVYDEEQIFDKIKKMYSLSNKIDRMSVIDLLNDFMEKDLYQKRDIIVVLLLDENNLESIIDDLYDKELFENIEIPSDINIKKLDIKILDIENQIKKSDSNSKDNIPNIPEEKVEEVLTSNGLIVEDTSNPTTQTIAEAVEKTNDVVIDNTIKDAISEEIKKEIAEEYCTDIINFEFLGYRDVHREHNGNKTHWIALDFKVLIDREKVKNGVPHKFDEIGWFQINKLPLCSSGCHE